MSIKRMGSMRTVIEEYGRNAGKIWKTLDKYGPLTETKLMKTAKLNEDEFYAAIGWLARENKICKKDITYEIGCTNLSDKIGIDAGKIWNVLYTWKEVHEAYIPKLADVPEKDMYYALGWLAREGKLTARKEKPKKAQITFCTK
jgi:hypothetical protein